MRGHVMRLLWRWWLLLLLRCCRLLHNSLRLSHAHQQLLLLLLWEHCHRWAQRGRGKHKMRNAWYLQLLGVQRR